MIMGDTISRSLGRQSASKLMRDVKPGCIIDCMGRPASLDEHTSTDSDTSMRASSDSSHTRGSSEACIEFVAESVTIVSPRVVSSRGNALPLQVLAALASPLYRVRGIDGGAMRLPQSSSALSAVAHRRKTGTTASSRPVQKYKCPLPDSDIIEVRYRCSMADANKLFLQPRRNSACSCSGKLDLWLDQGFSPVNAASYRTIVGINRPFLMFCHDRRRPLLPFRFPESRDETCYEWQQSPL